MGGAASAWWDARPSCSAAPALAKGGSPCGSHRVSDITVPELSEQAGSKSICRREEHERLISFCGSWIRALPASGLWVGPVAGSAGFTLRLIDDAHLVFRNLPEHWLGMGM